MSPDQGPVVIIGLKEIYDALLRLDGTVATLVTQHAETTTDVKDHEQRIRSLERFRWAVPSLAGLLAMASLGVAVLNYLSP